MIRKTFLSTCVCLLFCAVFPMQGQVNTLPDSLRAAILTPPVSKFPRINGAKVFGVRPGSAFLYTIAASGMKPLTYSVSGLPKGLKLDKKTGLISGFLQKKGEYVVTVSASNSVGKAARKLRIVVGDQIALTPPMGWNSWNCWGGAVSQEKVLSSARAFVEKGLRDHGWMYVNIDDGWQSLRGGKYNGILANKKFPDMKGLADEIHAMGLKFGIYSTPWIGTYEGHVGAYSNKVDGTYEWIANGNHNANYRIGPVDSLSNILRKTNYKHGQYSFVENDVKQWAEWGVDYLKYDWYPLDVPHVEEMLKSLRSQNRDIIYSLSNSAPFNEVENWAKLSNCWRTTGDIVDSWKRVTKIGFDQDKWTAYAGPGHFNDPDMLVLGWVGWGPRLHYTKLTIAEQYSHMSLWCLLSSPLLLGCDLSKLDDFTLSLLTNDEVLEIDQDALCKQAVHLINQDNKDVYVKQLEDGNIAVGLFNRGSSKTQISVSWSELGLTGSQIVRDLWRQKNLGTYSDKFEAEVDSHGVVLVKLTPSKGK